ncbi:hypothetical protein LPQ35_09245 [Geoglobus acetivorans]|uniref:RuvB-like AAA-lid domain-containing protein n=2 Tax=Geoglobus acetivorans TaxID=565033 RepID=A0ABZ3H6X6_GEOAI
MGLLVDDEALERLTDIGERYSLRYAIQLLAPSNEIAKIRNSGKIEVQDVDRAEKLFADVSKSSAYLKEWEEKLLQ